MTTVTNIAIMGFLLIMISFLLFIIGKGVSLFVGDKSKAWKEYLLTGAEVFFLLGLLVVQAAMFYALLYLLIEVIKGIM